MKKPVLKFTDKEKQVFVDLLPIVEDMLQKEISTIRQFKWLCLVPQAGEGYEQNRNVFALQEQGVKMSEAKYGFMRETLLKIINFRE